MHLKSDNKEFKTYDNVNDIVDKLFKAFLLRYHSGLVISMRGNDLFSIQFNCCIKNVTE